MSRQRHPDALRLDLIDQNEAMVSAWKSAFSGEPNVKVRHGSLLASRADTIVSPGNSFGDMGGGVDKAIDEFFSGRAQAAVVSRIRTGFLGELPVGMATLVPLEHRRVRFLLVAPTMRVPGNVQGTANAYLAFRAALVAVMLHNTDSRLPVQRLASPGMCTGVGGMSPSDAAQQMAAAYRNIMHGLWADVAHPAMAPYAMIEG